MTDLNNTRTRVRDNFRLLREEVVSHIDNMTLLSEEMDEHRLDENNPHDMDKHGVDLGDMQNYPAASDEEAKYGDMHDRYILANQLETSFNHNAAQLVNVADIRKPSIIGPKGGEVTESRYITLNAGPYGRSRNEMGIVVERKHREFQMIEAGGDFNDPAFTITKNEDNHVFEEIFDVDSSYVWRCRDVDNGNAVSEWSNEEAFTTPPAVWQQPVINVTGGAGVFAISVSNLVLVPAGMFEHDTSHMQVAADPLFTNVLMDVVKEQDILNFTISTLPDEQDIWVRVRVKGGPTKYSDWSNVLAFNTGISDASVLEINNDGDIRIVNGDESIVVGYATGSPSYPYAAKRNLITGVVVKEIRIEDALMENLSFLRAVDFSNGYICSVGEIDAAFGNYLVRLNSDLEIVWVSEFATGIHDIAISADGATLLFTSVVNSTMVVSSVNVSTGAIVASRQYEHTPTELGKKSIRWNPAAGNFYVFGQTTAVIDQVTGGGDRSIFLDILNTALNPVGELLFMTINQGTFADVAVIGSVPYLFVNTNAGVNMGTFNNATWVRLTDSTVVMTSCTGVDNSSIVCLGKKGNATVLFQAQVGGNRVTSVNWGRSIQNVGKNVTMFKRGSNIDFTAGSTESDNVGLVFTVKPGANYDVIPSKADVAFVNFVPAVTSLSRSRAGYFTAWSNWARVDVPGSTSTTGGSPSAQPVAPGNSNVTQYQNPTWQYTGTGTGYNQWSNWTVLSLGNAMSSANTEPYPLGNVLPADSPTVQYIGGYWKRADSHSYIEDGIVIYRWDIHAERRTRTSYTYYNYKTTAERRTRSLLYTGRSITNTVLTGNPVTLETAPFNTNQVKHNF